MKILSCVCMVIFSALALRADAEIVVDDYPGSMCMPTRPSASGLVYGTWGYVRNDGSRTETVNCPIKVNELVSRLVVVIRMGYFSGRKAASSDYIRCTLSSAFGNRISHSRKKSFHEERTLLSDDIIVDIEGGNVASLSCRLPRHATIWGYQVRADIFD